MHKEFNVGELLQQQLIDDSLYLLQVHGELLCFAGSHLLQQLVDFCDLQENLLGRGFQILDLFIKLEGVLLQVTFSLVSVFPLQLKSLLDFHVNSPKLICQQIRDFLVQLGHNVVPNSHALNESQGVNVVRPGVFLELELLRKRRLEEILLLDYVPEFRHLFFHLRRKIHRELQNVVSMNAFQLQQSSLYLYLLILSSLIYFSIPHSLEVLVVLLDLLSLLSVLQAVSQNQLNVVHVLLDMVMNLLAPNVGP